MFEQKHSAQFFARDGFRHPESAHRWLSSLTLAGVLCFGSWTALGADAAVSKEYQLKAAFLYNFTKFIEWPPQRFPDETSPFIIGVLERNPFGDELERVVKGRILNGRAIVVKLIHTAEEALTVHLLFVPSGLENRLPAAVWQNAAVVAVGESEAFAALGGTIVFTREADKVRFAINLESTERNGLKISAQLLKLASDVRRKS